MGFLFLSFLFFDLHQIYCGFFLGFFTVFCVLVGKTPEEVVKRYLQKVRNPPEEVSFVILR